MYHPQVYSASSGTRPKLKPVAIDFDSPELIRLQDNDDSDTSPNSAMSYQSHYTPDTHTYVAANSPVPREEMLKIQEDEKDPSLGTERSTSVSSDSGKSDREKPEKRKRSRVTPEQLAHLERYFQLDRSPTAVRRREISEILGMQERQTQIWFQNR